MFTHRVGVATLVGEILRYYNSGPARPVRPVATVLAVPLFSRGSGILFIARVSVTPC